MGVRLFLNSNINELNNRGKGSDIFQGNIHSGSLKYKAALKVLKHFFEKVS